ncbi:uncharacterized protein LOC134221870 [Armigeres subalbatus]|uniref:uncharacterized protein LOC134221870 n=1 Tax=Armigeres subalbatus TaxID=124917 RepID=UPI002ED62E0C
MKQQSQLVQQVQPERKEKCSPVFVKGDPPDLRLKIRQLIAKGLKFAGQRGSSFTPYPIGTYNMQDTRPVPAFRCDQIETSKLSKEWKTWKEALQCYFAAYDITDQYAKKAKLLHLGGPALQVVFKNLKDHDHVPLVTLEPKWYDCAIEKLDEFFEPRHQSTSERRKLRLMKQKAGERFADYVIRLKQQVAQCGFEKYGVEVSLILSEIYMIDAVVEGCASNEVRRRILLMDLSFTEIEALGIAQESVEQQIEEIATGQPPEKVFKVEQSGKFRGKFPLGGTKPTDRSCFNCGRLGHLAASPICPARGKQCRNCKCYGHFEKLCRKTKRSVERNVEKVIRAVEEGPNPEVSKKEPETNEAKVYYAFYSGNESYAIECVVGGFSLDMLVDSGVDSNLVSGTMWQKMKEKNVMVFSSVKGSSRILRAYGNTDPLVIQGSFVADISVIRAEFFVVEGGQRCLLGDQTAKQLGVLKVGMNINSVEMSPFSKMQGITAKILMDPQVIPVYQPMRRIPVPLEESVDRKLDELLRRDIIEVKTGPTTWVSPLVVVGKTNGEPRLCLDLRRVNEAVLREHHPMPSVDDYLAKLGRGRIWSKLDIKEAFLQIEIEEDSRDATTFITRRGLFRFKRLPFGLVTAPELFQKAMDEILSGCEGTVWYLDDVLVEGNNLQEHDERLDKRTAKTVAKRERISINGYSKPTLWITCQWIAVPATGPHVYQFTNKFPCLRHSELATFGQKRQVEKCPRTPGSVLTELCSQKTIFGESRAGGRCA